MGLLDTVKEIGVKKVLDNLKDTVFNPAIFNIGTITELSYKDKSLTFAVILKGMEDHEIEVACHSIAISDDASEITLKDFTSNKEFAHNALNMFAARTYPVPDKPGIRLALKGAKTVLGL